MGMVMSMMEQTIAQSTRITARKISAQPKSIVNAITIAPKTTKNTQGVAAMTLKKGQRVLKAVVYKEGDLQNPARFKKKIPALGALPNGEEYSDTQMEL